MISEVQTAKSNIVIGVNVRKGCTQTNQFTELFFTGQ